MEFDKVYNVFYTEPNDSRALGHGPAVRAYGPGSHFILIQEIEKSLERYEAVDFAGLVPGVRRNELLAERTRNLPLLQTMRTQVIEHSDEIVGDLAEQVEHYVQRPEEY